MLSLLAIVAMSCVIVILLGVVAGGVVAALPHAEGPAWPDRLRRGTKAFVVTVTLCAVLAGMASALVAVAQGISGPHQ